MSGDMFTHMYDTENDGLPEHDGCPPEVLTLIFLAVILVLAGIVR